VTVQNITVKSMALVIKTALITCLTM